MTAGFWRNFTKAVQSPYEAIPSPERRLQRTHLQDHIRKATTQHPEGSRIAVYLDDDATHPKELWIHSALPFEKDEDLSRPAHQKAKEHAEANFPK